MTHVVVGYPTLPATTELVRTMAACGVDFVELQIPFSDPLADGPTIQKACEASLARGTKVFDAFETARTLASQVDIPLLFMAYFNTVYKYGIEKFCTDANAAGISGLIVPDIPLEAAQHEGFLEACLKHNLHNIITLAPTSSKERLAKNAAIVSGFAYCMTRSGTTGARRVLDPDIASYLKNVRHSIKVPLAAGFGISTYEHLQTLKPHADIAVIGSALINTIARSDRHEITKNVQIFIKQLQGDDTI
jgi:tryptophan synthase alpha subunit